jgi:hypothetical protein
MGVGFLASRSLNNYSSLYPYKKAPALNTVLRTCVNGINADCSCEQFVGQAKRDTDHVYSLSLGDLNNSGYNCHT